MCGICGAYYFDHHRPVTEETVVAMRDTMVHRGPDGFGVFTDKNVGLGHRRLSIVDIEGGHQPMSNEDGTVWITFNGEIYNHAELRRELAAKGHTFRTNCDTEAIVHLYEEHGERCVDKLQGMFAFAVYDARRRRLLLARDRIGIKPLYYYRTDEVLLFGSEIKSILAHPDVTPSVNWSALPALLQYGSVYGQETLFESVRELEPGYVLSATPEGVSVSAYWDLPAFDSNTRGLEDARAHMEELLRVSIQRRMMSDVPLGAFLSGGVDSSLIVAIMSEMASEPIQTFSIGFQETGFNEFEYSRLVAKRYRTEHHEFLLDTSMFFDALPDLVWHYDEPVSLPASIPLYFLSKATKGSATVILTGEGADEVFLGYERYPWVQKHAALAGKFRATFPTFLQPPIVGLAQSLLGPNRPLLDRLLMSPPELAASFLEWSSRRTVGSVLNEGTRDLWARDSREDFCLTAYQRSNTESDTMSRNTYLDFKTFLITLLMKQDKMSMAASIESRVPFLDHELVGAGCSLRTEWKLGDGERKRILKEIAARYLPHELIYRKKQGFPVPITPWLQETAGRRRFEEILFDDSVRRRGIFNLDSIEAQIRIARSSDARASRGASYLVWTIVNFELWYQTFMEGTQRPLRAETKTMNATRTRPGASDGAHV